MTRFKVKVRLFDGSEWRTADSYETREQAQTVLRCLMDGEECPPMVGPTGGREIDWIVRSEMIVAGGVFPAEQS